MSIVAEPKIKIDLEDVNEVRTVPVTVTAKSTKSTIPEMNEVLSFTFNLLISYCPSDFSTATSGTFKKTIYLRSDDEVVYTAQSKDSRQCTRTKFKAKYNN